MTDITTLESFIDFKASDGAAKEGRQKIKSKKEEIKQATRQWKLKEQELEKALNSQNSTFSQIEALEAAASDLRDAIQPLKDALTTLHGEQTTLTADRQTKADAFLNEAVPLVRDDINAAATKVEEALDLLLQISSNASAAEPTPFKNIPVIHAAIDYARLAQRHITQSREKFDTTHG